MVTSQPRHVSFAEPGQQKQAYANYEPCGKLTKLTNLPPTQQSTLATPICSGRTMALLVPAYLKKTCR